MGAGGEIVAVKAKGALQARLADLGFIRHSRVTCLFASALGDPRAYEIRGSVIALRGKDARQIEIFCGEESL